MLSLKEHRDTLLFSEECWENPDDTDHILLSTYFNWQMLDLSGFSFHLGQSILQ